MLLLQIDNTFENLGLVWIGFGVLLLFGLLVMFFSWYRKVPQGNSGSTDTGGNNGLPLWYFS
ncbi:MAG: hypothetical protein AAFO02_10020, partial [Bacteroidota bacterium]